MIIVRWADDFIVGFEDERDARQFLDELRERFAQFGLELHPDKTRLIEFGRHAGWKRAKRGLGKPETFDFLGFTHIGAKGKKPVYALVLLGILAATGCFFIARGAIGRAAASSGRRPPSRARPGFFPPADVLSPSLRRPTRGAGFGWATARPR